MDFSFADTVWIKFRNDEENVGKGFMLHYRTADNVVLNGYSGELTSPGYPNSYMFTKRTFTWTISVPERYIRLDFVELDLTGDQYQTGMCSIRLAIFDGELLELADESLTALVMATFRSRYLLDRCPS